ncbi:hypothetical protein RND81_12G225100 [Saponaria officinalis]|uniref:Neurochondrin n=1 Tax=Saponaria officinalis TaxID=3572 RepID=A0AAW1HE67_SAPOF
MEHHLPSPSSSSFPSPAPLSSAGLDDCLKLLSGDTDEQRLAGLLLVTKFCNKDDHHSLRLVYHAISPLFLHRLLLTGMREGGSGNNDSDSDNRDAYLHLCVTVLAAFCRVPDIAASSDMQSKIPSILKVMENHLEPSLLEDCYEFLFLISTNSEDGVMKFFESGGLRLLAAHLPSLSDGSHALELSLRLVQLVFIKIPLDTIINRNLSELSTMVPFIARQFALLQNALKFDLLRLLCVILSSDHSAPLHALLQSKSNDKWPVYVRAGVVDILQNRIAADQRLQGLIVAESMVSLLGEGWLINQMDVPDVHKPSSSDRCLLLVLESARVEVAVLLNELAYTKYEASSSKSEALPLKISNLAIAFSLVEKVIKLISNISDEGGIVSDDIFTKVISGLNETLEVVLEYLKDAKDHGQKKGDDLLASVRVAGSYLAEAPLACKDKVKDLLSYLLSVEGENEPSPFMSVCFMLPFLCQATMTVEGVQILASSGAYKAVMECFARLVEQDPHLVEDKGCIFLACDTVMNFLLKREHIMIQLDESSFVHVLMALAYWTEGTCDSSIIMMASSICSLIFEAMSEETLLQYPDVNLSVLRKLSQLIAKSLSIREEDMGSDDKSEADLREIIASGYSRWSDRFPLVRQAVEG